MSIKDKYKVLPIPKQQTHEWLLKKHYAKRLPMAIEYSYGLYSEHLQGVCVFGPTAPPVPITIFGEHGKHKVRELTRLVVEENLEKGVLSYFVSNCLKLLPKPLCIVSFADKGAGHHGYIYQATNWLYTGSGGARTDIVDSRGKPVHNLTINDGCQRENLSRKVYMQKYSLTETEAEPKFRYLYFIGNKTEKKEMLKDLVLECLDYPKGDNERYDASYHPDVQQTFFV